MNFQTLLTVPWRVVSLAGCSTSPGRAGRSAAGLGRGSQPALGTAGGSNVASCSPLQVTAPGMEGSQVTRRSLGQVSELAARDKPSSCLLPAPCKLSKVWSQGNTVDLGALSCYSPLAGSTIFPHRKMHIWWSSFTASYCLCNLQSAPPAWRTTGCVRRTPASLQGLVLPFP